MKNKFLILLTVMSLNLNAAETCKDITCVRKHIDLINVKIVQLIAQRSKYVEQAARIKGPHHRANDSRRVSDELEKIKKIAHEYHAPENVTLNTFKTLIADSIAYEQTLIDRIKNDK